ncbi:MAG TPA: hypothetical protein VF335_07685, partial [Chitinivibrionales bacterium]
MKLLSEGNKLLTFQFKNRSLVNRLLIVSILSGSVYASSGDNSYFNQVTGLKVEYFQWNEYDPFLPPEFNDIVVSEKGPLYHLILNWNIHNKTRFCFNVNTDVFWGVPDYTSHNYAEALDTFLTANASTQYVGINLGVSFGVDLKKMVIGK